MKRLTLELKTVTPLFIAGADPEIGAELREPSIKGALRFWFRAIYPNYTREEEARIFGSTARQSGMILRITDRPQIATGQKDKKLGKHIAYLGYGAIDKGKTTRPYFTKDKTFTLNLLFKPSLSDDDRHQVERSLWAWLTFGGIGARSRRGFGSLTVESIGGDIASDLIWRFSDNDILRSAIDSFIESIADKPSSLAEYTCFSNGSRCVVVLCPKEFSKREHPALEYIGEEMLDYRSYKSTERENGVRRFQNDHDIMQKYLDNNIKPTSCPMRATFGLPHNYYFSSLKKGGAVNFMENGKAGRRASPLFISVQGLNNGASAVVLTFLPASQRMGYLQRSTPSLSCVY